MEYIFFRYTLIVCKFPVDRYNQIFRKKSRSMLKLITHYSRETGIHFLNEDNSVSRDYANGYTLFAFDLTSDLSANCARHWNLVKHGSLRLEVRFEKALSVTINCIVYAEFDNVLEIDSSRQVILDFSG